MKDCGARLADLRARFILMEQHYHEDMNELFAEIERLKTQIAQLQQEREERETLPAFLTYLNQQMMKYPELTVEADEARLQRIAELVKDVELETFG